MCLSVLEYQLLNSHWNISTKIALDRVAIWTKIVCIAKLILNLDMIILLIFMFIRYVCITATYIDVGSVTC